MNRPRGSATKPAGATRQSRERKKLVALGVLLLLGLAIWGRMLLSDGPRPASAHPAAATAQSPADTVESTRRPVVDVHLPSTVDRDLFALDPAAYRRSGPAPEPEIPADRAKSAPDPSDELERRRRAVRAEAQGLRLQGTLEGSAPKAMINGQLIEPGQTVEGFTLIEIGSRRATVEKQGVRIVLEM